MKQTQAVVIGGGVIGSAIALTLQRAGLATVLVQPKTQTRAASWGNAGHIATEQTRPLAAPEALRSAPRRLFAMGGALDFRLLDMMRRTDWLMGYLQASSALKADQGQAVLKSLLRDAMPAWRRLAQAAGRPELVMENGHLVVWETPRSAEAGRTHWSETDTGEARLQDIPGAQWAALKASIKPRLHGGLAFSGSGQIEDPGLALAALQGRFTECGGEILQDKAALSRLGDRTIVDLESGEPLKPDYVIVAAGVESEALLGPLGLNAPIIAERGYHLEYNTSSWRDLPPVVFEDRAMIVTRFGDRLRAASFVEFGRNDAPADPRKFARLARHVAALGLPIEGEAAPWMGARPTLPDYLPAIGESQRHPGLFYAFGHQHLGLTLAAVTAEIIAMRMNKDAAPPWLDALSLERFRSRQN